MMRAWVWAWAWADKSRGVHIDRTCMTLWCSLTMVTGLRSESCRSTAPGRQAPLSQRDGFWVLYKYEYMARG